MARAPFQVLVYPYLRSADGRLEYALLKRSEEGFWQGIAGGGEDDERPLEAARRETFEEAGIGSDAEFLRLDTVESVPVTEFRDSTLWGDDVYVVPQYCFGVRVQDRRIALSQEHTEYAWLPYDQARKLLKFDGNRTALWELDARLRGRGPRGVSRGTLQTAGLEADVITYQLARDDQIDDFIRLLRLEAEAYLDSTLAALGATWDELARLARTVGQVQVVCLDDHLVGYLWTEERDRIVHIHGIVVEPKYQGRGIGTELLRMLKEKYAGRIDAIELGVHDSNARARALYERSGFRLVQRRDDLGFAILQQSLQDR